MNRLATFIKTLHLTHSSPQKGNRDYKYFPERVLIKDLRPNMINVCLFGRIVAMFNNVCFFHDVVY